MSLLSFQLETLYDIILAPASREWIKTCSVLCLTLCLSFLFDIQMFAVILCIHLDPFFHIHSLPHPCFNVFIFLFLLSPVAFLSLPMACEELAPSRNISPPLTLFSHFSSFSSIFFIINVLLSYLILHCSFLSAFLSLTDCSLLSFSW